MASLEQNFIQPKETIVNKQRQTLVQKYDDINGILYYVSKSNLNFDIYFEDGKQAWAEQ